MDPSGGRSRRGELQGSLRSLGNPGARRARKSPRELRRAPMSLGSAGELRGSIGKVSKGELKRTQAKTTKSMKHWRAQEISGEAVWSG